MWPLATLLQPVFWGSRDVPQLRRASVHLPCISWLKLASIYHEPGHCLLLKAKAAGFAYFKRARGPKGRLSKFLMMAMALTVDAWTAGGHFGKLWGRRSCGRRLELSPIGSISGPQDQESIQSGVLTESFIWSPPLAGLPLFHREDTQLPLVPNQSWWINTPS